MKFKIFYSKLFKEQIEDIFTYLINKYGEEIAKEKYLELQKSILNLEDNPYLGLLPRYREIKKKGYRALIVGKNIVFYLVDENVKEVHIIAITDYRKDYISIFDEL